MLGINIESLHSHRGAFFLFSASRISPALVPKDTAWISWQSETAPCFLIVGTSLILLKHFKYLDLPVIVTICINWYSTLKKKKKGKRKFWGVAKIKGRLSAWLCLVCIFTLMSGVCINNAFDCFKDGAGVTMALESWHFLFVSLPSVRNNIELFC